MKKILIMSLLFSGIFASSEGYFLYRNSYNPYPTQEYLEQDTLYYDNEPIAQEYYDQISSEPFSSYEEQNYSYTMPMQNGYYYSQDNRNNSDIDSHNDLRQNDLTDQEEDRQAAPSASEDKHINDIQKKYPQDRAASAGDRQLNAKIRDKISEGWFWRSYETVKLDTNNGVVFLEGFVEKPADQDKIIGEIRKISGVRGVNSNLQINKK